MREYFVFDGLVSRRTQIRIVPFSDGCGKRGRAFVDQLPDIIVVVYPESDAFHAVGIYVVSGRTIGISADQVFIVPVDGRFPVYQSVLEIDRIFIFMVDALSV